VTSFRDFITMHRVNQLSKHLSAKSCHGAGSTVLKDEVKEVEELHVSDEELSRVHPRVVESLEKFFGTDRLKSSPMPDDETLKQMVTHLDQAADPSSPAAIAATLLPGPLHAMSRLTALKERILSESAGEGHIYWAQCQMKYGDQGLSSNFVVPWLHTSIHSDMPHLSNLVILSHPKDSARIARAHVKKAPNFTPILAGSVISTQSNSHWKRQREQLTTAFMPNTALAKIFDKSVERARYCTGIVTEMCKGGNKAMDMSDFYLHEAQAQLQLALFGMDTEFMDKTNASLREAFAGRAREKNYVTKFLLNIIREMESKNEQWKDQGDVNGPLSHVILGEAAARLQQGQDQETGLGDDGYMTKFGNALIFAFAGHDTTGHTMTWLTFELSKPEHAHYQQRLQKEVDALFEDLKKEGDRPLQYRDCRKLPFLTKCIMETLRLWPAVANGTFRELQFDDVVVGPGGKDVKLKKGTYVQISNWSRHRNPELWGQDASVFNPDREFTSDELWNGDAFMCYNPSTERFSPFTFPPRDCLGKNFAQMEMRTILSHLFRNFTFKLAPPTDAYDPSSYLGINRGTMGPQDLGGFDKRSDGSNRNRLGMHCYAIPRR